MSTWATNNQQCMNENKHMLEFQAKRSDNSVSDTSVIMAIWCETCVYNFEH
jgi:hypothetical protein